MVEFRADTVDTVAILHDHNSLKPNFPRFGVLGVMQDFSVSTVLLRNCVLRLWAWGFEVLDAAFGSYGL